jgi:hypothetical protein
MERSMNQQKYQEQYEEYWLSKGSYLRAEWLRQDRTHMKGADSHWRVEE